MGINSCRNHDRAWVIDASLLPPGDAARVPLGAGCGPRALSTITAGAHLYPVMARPITAGWSTQQPRCFDCRRADLQPHVERLPERFVEPGRTRIAWTIESLRQRTSWSASRKPPSATPLIGESLSALAGVLAGCSAPHTSTSTNHPPSGDAHMRLGNFSVSLTVKDAGSHAFYEKLGFKVIAGDQAKNWLMLQNETSTIGLFQGMFERNTLTFTPGWDRAGNTLTSFDDIRDLQRALRAQGLEPAPAADETTTGPTHLMVLDPDGNPILVDQHVPSPQK
jgi:hypothetical protein